MISTVFAGGKRFHRFHAKYLESDRLVVVQAKDEDKDYKVDWETFARYNPVPWQIFAKEDGRVVGLSVCASLEQTTSTSSSWIADACLLT